jgi:hypothetical protein
VKKQTTGMTPDGLPVHSFRTLLADRIHSVKTAAVRAAPFPVKFRGSASGLSDRLYGSR